MRLLPKALFVAGAFMLLLPLAAGAVVINEIRIDQPGGDTDEYFELFGQAGESLDDLYYIVIGDGSGVFDGVVEEITVLSGVMPADGYFTAAESTFTLGTWDLLTDLNFENSDNVTHLLVSRLNPAINVGSGFGGSDLDVDDDGVIDPTGDYDGDSIDDGPPWMMVVDCVGLVETVGSGDMLYCSTLVGPDGTFVPGHVFLCPPPDGWQIGVFDPVGGVDTADAPNTNCPVPTEPSTWGKIKSIYR